MQTAITDIQYLPDFTVFQSVSPAIVNRATGVMYINLSVWSTLPAESRLFIMLHEAGHATLQTMSEHEADQWAFDQYAKLGYPLTSSVYALSRVLKFNKAEDYERLQNQLIRAAEFDFYTNHNEKVKNMLTPGIMKGNNELLFTQNNTKVKKLYPRKTEPLFAANDGDEIGPPAYNYDSLSSGEPGSKIGDWLTNVGSGLGVVADAVGSIVGGVKSAVNPVPEPTDEPEKKNSTWIWIALAVAAMVAVGITIYVVKSSKS